MSNTAEGSPQELASQAVQTRVQQSRRMVRGMVGLGLFAGVYAGTQNPYGYTVELLEPTVVAGSVIAAASERALMYRSLNKTIKGYAESRGVFGPTENGTQRPRITVAETRVDRSNPALEDDPDLQSTNQVSDVFRSSLATLFTYGSVGTGVSIVTGEAAHYDVSPGTLYGYTFVFGSVAFKSMRITENNANIAEQNALQRIDNISSVALLNPILRSTE